MEYDERKKRLLKSNRKGLTSNRKKEEIEQWKDTIENKIKWNEGNRGSKNQFLLVLSTVVVEQVM